MLGRGLKSGPDDPCRADELLESMDREGIAEALVLDSLSRQYHPAAGNGRIIETVSGRPRLHPAWAVLPHGANDEQPSPEEMLRRMEKHRVGALFLFPIQYGFRLCDWTVNSFFESFARLGVPVFINYNDNRNMATDSCRWDELVDFCRRWPSLPVILSEFRLRRKNRMLYRALDACENLHVELSGYWLYRGIEYLVKNWGAERLIFGSNWPHLNQSCSAAAVTMAEVDESDKRLIAGENLRRLINWCEPFHSEITLPEPQDDFARFAQTGVKAEGMSFLDCHGHLGGYSPEYHIPDSDVDSTVREMERMGVDKACVFSFSVIHGDERPGNDLVAEAAASYPDRFMGLAGINPHRGEEKILKELSRCRDMGLRGIKLIPQYQDFPADDPLIEVCCRWAHKHRWIILNHDWGSCEHLESLLSKYPGARFIAGHAAPHYGPLARKHSNLWVCTCPVHRPGSCERLVEAVGVDSVLFGSDLQDLPISWGLGPILQADLSIGDKSRILSGNLARIFRAGE